MEVMYYMCKDGYSELEFVEGAKRGLIELTPEQAEKLLYVVPMCVPNEATFHDVTAMQLVHELYEFIQVNVFIDREDGRADTMMNMVKAYLDEHMDEVERLKFGLRQAKATLRLWNELLGQNKAVAMAELDYDEMLADVERWTTE